MRRDEIKNRYPMLDKSFFTSPFVSEIIRSPNSVMVNGTYKQYGGNPEEFIEEAIKCPSCGSSKAIPCDVVGYISCDDCCEANPAALWHIDNPKKAREIYNNSVSEVISNNDNVARLNEIASQYNDMYWELIVRHEPNQGNVPSFILQSRNFAMFRFYAGKNEPDLHEQIVECIATDNLSRDVYDAYCRFLRCDPTMMRVDGKKTLVVTATPKHDLLKRLKEYYSELKKYRAFAEEYMIDFTEDEIDEDIFEEEDD